MGALLPTWLHCFAVVLVNSLALSTGFPQILKCLSAQHEWGGGAQGMEFI